MTSATYFFLSGLITDAMNSLTVESFIPLCGETASKV